MIKFNLNYYSFIFIWSNFTDFSASNKDHIIYIYITLANYYTGSKNYNDIVLYCIIYY